MSSDFSSNGSSGIPDSLREAEARALQLRKRGKFREAAKLAKEINGFYYHLYDQQDYSADICHPAMDKWLAFANECLTEAQKSAAPKKQEPKGLLNRGIKIFKGLFASRAQGVPASLTSPVEISSGFEKVCAMLVSKHAKGVQAMRTSLKKPLRGGSLYPAGKVFSLQENETSQTLGLPENTRHFTLSPDKRRLAVYTTTQGGGLGGRCDILVWDMVEKKTLALLDQNNEVHIGALTFSPDGEFLIVDRVRTIELYSMNSLRKVGEWASPVPYPYGVNMSPGGRFLVIGSARGLVAVNFLEEPGRSYVLEAHLEYGWGFVCADSKTLVTVGIHQNELKFWDLETGKLKKASVMKCGWQAWSHEQSWMALSEKTESVKVIRLPDGETLCEFGSFDAPLSVFSICGGKVLMVVDKKGEHSFHDPVSGRKLCEPVSLEGWKYFGEDRQNNRLLFHDMIEGKAQEARIRSFTIG